MINRWTYNTPVNIQEIRLGNRFHSQEIDVCIITDIDTDSLQLLNTFNGETYAGETINSIRPIFLSDGDDISLENDMLEELGFRYHEERHQFEKEDIVVKQGLAADHWTVSKGLEVKKILFQHELQNAITDFTQNVLN